MNEYVQEAVTIFRREPEEIELLKSCKLKAHEVCCKHIGRRVRVQMLDGTCFEGELAGSDEDHAYLRIDFAPGPAQTDRQFPYYSYPPYYYNPYYSTILPLVLFNLLAISLI